MDVTTVLRVAFSLAVVVGLLWLSYRVADRSRRGAPAGRTAQLTVVARQGLSPKSVAVLLDAGGTRYLLGVTDSSVTVIDQGPAPAAPPAPGPASPKHAVRGAAVPRLGPLNAVKSTTWSRSADSAAGAGVVDHDGPATQDAPSGTTDLASPSFDEAVLAAQGWLDDALVPSGAPAGPAPAGPVRTVTATAVGAAPSGTPVADPTGPATTRPFLALDTWRHAARSVWGPRR